MKLTASQQPRTRSVLPFHWPDPPLSVVLVEPEIPPNTGNIARCCAATGAPLHLIEPLGFKLGDSAVRRAGLDYWDRVEVRRHANWEAFIDQTRPARFFLFSTFAPRSFHKAHFQPGDYLVFGKETKGLPESLLTRWPDRVFGIPMQPQSVRSLNLSTSVGIVLYEALRQINYRLDVPDSP